jgi:DNA invertase Pin-like site-specific DNA recombinase
MSSDERLDQAFNSIDAQREAGQAFLASQQAEGWIPVAGDYDDPGLSGGNIERAGLKRLMGDIQAGRLDIVVVYKIDRLTRSLICSNGLRVFVSLDSACAPHKLILDGAQVTDVPVLLRW